VQDFKHHPYYALERHLRRHEVIHPRREVGKVNAGTAAKPRMEVVFRRSDVQACKSAEKWFRVGREIKEGEQPLKRVSARRSRTTRAASPDEEGEVEISALYAPFQTTLYVPPPVVKGRVPRNAYGNLDVYVPSMVPPGGAHVRHPLAKEAARTLRIDAVDAVTGFKFQGPQGTAVIEGIIIAEEYKDAIEAVIDGLQDDQTEQESMARSALALKMWKRFLTALRIKERVSAYGDGTTDGDDDVDMVEDGDGEDETAGGFLADGTDQHVERGSLSTAGKYSLAEILSATPTKRSRAKRKINDDTDESEEADFSEAQSVDEEEGGFEPDISATRTRRSRRLVVEEDSEDEKLPFNDEKLNQSERMLDNEGRGFVRDEGMEGGFLVEEQRDTNDDLMQGYENTGGFVVDEQDLTYPQTSTEGNAEKVSGNVFDESIPIEDHEDVHMPDKSATPPPRAHTPTCDGERSGVANEPISENITPNTAYEGEPAESKSEDRVPVESAQTEWQVHGLAEAQQHVWPEEADDDSDRGSMLSHDPEDEDAEPDWLESD
jgi:xeroderma pigmentosum group C-complementing protein